MHLGSSQAIKIDQNSIAIAKDFTAKIRSGHVRLLGALNQTT